MSAAPTGVLPLVVEARFSSFDTSVFVVVNITQQK
jgi:hypothetical protein